MLRHDDAARRGICSQSNELGYKKDRHAQVLALFFQQVLLMVELNETRGTADRQRINFAPLQIQHFCPHESDGIVRMPRISQILPATEVLHGVVRHFSAERLNDCIKLLWT